MMVDGYLLRYQAKQIEYFLGKGSFLNPIKEKTDIFRDVLLKIINELKPMICNDYGFEFDNICYDSKTMRSIGEINTDKIMLNQVFFNLFMNALKYSKKAPTKKIQLDVKHHNREGKVAIIFRDWGIGIDSRHQDAIFIAGFRTPDAIKTAMGSGLGLAISKEIMQKLGGDLILKNLAQPTEFQVILPKGDQ
jgi:signal transduction histidine kinase